MAVYKRSQIQSFFKDCFVFSKMSNEENQISLEDALLNSEREMKKMRVLGDLKVRIHLYEHIRNMDLGEVSVKDIYYSALDELKSEEIVEDFTGEASEFSGIGRKVFSGLFI